MIATEFLQLLSISLKTTTKQPAARRQARQKLPVAKFASWKFVLSKGEGRHLYGVIAFVYHSNEIDKEEISESRLSSAGERCPEVDIFSMNSFFIYISDCDLFDVWLRSKPQQPHAATESSESNRTVYAARRRAAHVAEPAAQRSLAAQRTAAPDQSGRAVNCAMSLEPRHASLASKVCSRRFGPTHG